MITKEVIYENFDGVEVKETLHFHLNKQEITEFRMTKEDMIKNMIDAVENKNTSEIFKMFKALVLKSYGIRADNNTFLKGEATKNFEYTLAYEAVMEDITKDSTSMFAFIKGVLPKELSKDLPDTPEYYTEERTQELLGELKQKVNA